MNEDSKVLAPLTDSERKSQSKSIKSQCTPIIPVPDDAPELNNRNQLVIHYNKKFGLPKPSMTHRYHDQNGNLLGFILRWDITAKDGTVKKEIRPFLYCEYPNGEKKWASCGFPEPRPLYNLHELSRQSNDPTIVGEGEKTADVLQLLFPDCVSTTAMHGAQSPHKTDWSPLKDRDVIISPDNDEPGKNCADNVYTLAKAAGAKSIRLLSPSIFGEYALENGQIIRSQRDPKVGFDLADAAEDGWTADHIQQLAVILQQEGRSLFTEYPEPPIVEAEKARPALPFGFSMKKDGLYYEDEWVCSPIEAIAHTRDEVQENWGILVRFADLDGYIHEIAIPMEIMKGDCSDLRGLLLSLGLRITSQRVRNKLADYLQNIKPGKKAFCTSRIGWHGSHFVLPNGSIPETDEVYLQSDNNNFAGFRRAGTLNQWQEHVAIPCRGNSRLVFSLSCSFGAPLFPLVHIESGGFNLKGASSIGKSTALAVAASVWGSPKFIQQWKATGNAVEAVAEAYNNALLPLDELGLVDGREAGEIGYMLANGSGKNRMKAKGGLRRKLEWELLFLSTGEISIADKMNEAGKRVQAGMMTRMVDIPADANKGHRLFDTIHAFKNGNVLANHLKNSVGLYYGTPIQAYLTHLVQIKGELSKVVEQCNQDFFTEFVPNDADGQVQRVANRFVVVTVGGELAIKLGILPYDRGEAFDAIGRCFQAWLEERGSTKGYEGEEGVRQVRAFIETHHSSRFALMGQDDKNIGEESKIINQAGFKRKTKRANADEIEAESWEFFVFPETFRNEICKGLDYHIVCKELAEKGFLLRGNERQFVKDQRLPIGKKKMYCFTSAILTGGEE